MKKMIFLLFIVLLCLIYTIPTQAVIKKVAQTGLQFLKVDVGSRASAMGGSYAMVGNDVTAMFYNPVGIAHLQSKYEFFVARTEWIADISYNAGGIAANFGNWGAVGLSFITCDYGDIQGTRVASTVEGYEDTNMLDVGAYSIGLTYAYALTNKFSVGGQIKFAAQDLGESVIDVNGKKIDNKVSGIAYDFGTMFYPGFKSFRLGMYIRNFSQQFKYEKEAFQLPLTFAIGFAMDVLDIMSDEHENSLLVSFDALHPRDYTERIHLGAEYTFLDFFSLRAGYKFNYDEESLTGGVGLKTNVRGLGVNVGYAYSDFGVFDSVNRISFVLSF